MALPSGGPTRPTSSPPPPWAIAIAMFLNEMGIAIGNKQGFSSEAPLAIFRLAGNMDFLKVEGPR